MKTIFCFLFAVLLLNSSKSFAQSESPPECLNLEEVQQKIGFPMEAKRAGAKGKVITKITVGANGKVEKHEIASSPSKLLSDAVSAHIEDLKFRPAKLNGKAIRSIVMIPIVFDAGDGIKVFTSLEEALTTTEVVENVDLSGQNLRSLDPRITRLKSLRKISLNNNSFAEIPTVLGKLPTLANVEINGNQVKSVPSFLKKMKSLQSLDIRNNQIPTPAIAKARQMLEHVDLLAD